MNIDNIHNNLQKEFMSIEEKILNTDIKHEKQIRKSIDLMLDFGNKIHKLSNLKKSRNRYKWQIKHDKEIMSLCNKVLKITELQLDILDYISRKCIEGKITRSI